MPQYPAGLASSQDNTQLSLTVSSVTQLLLWLVAWFAVSKGLNPMDAQTNAQAYIDVIVNAIPLIMALYHSVMVIWGGARKLFALSKKVPVSAQQ